jgi:prepilin-type N-terminal cleavage/methylation domain-containing protein
MVGHRKKFNWQAENGFGLIEVLASLTILAVILLTFSTLLNNGYAISSDTKQQNLALGYAQEKMEEIKATWPATVDEANSKASRDLNDTVAGTNFTRTWDAVATQSQGNGLYVKNFLKVTVHVSWQFKGAARSVQVISYMTGRSK